MVALEQILGTFKYTALPLGSLLVKTVTRITVLLTMKNYIPFHCVRLTSVPFWNADIHNPVLKFTVHYRGKSTNNGGNLLSGRQNSCALHFILTMDK